MQQIQKDKLYFVLPDKIKLKYTSEEIAKSQKMRREVCYAETVLDEQATPPERIDKYEADKIASKKTKAKTQQELTQLHEDANLVRRFLCNLKLICQLKLIKINLRPSKLCRQLRPFVKGQNQL